MNKLTIVSIVYVEPEWQETKKCIEATGLPVVYVDRDPIGVGSLAEAINRGFKNAPESEFIWFVTNVTFKKELAEDLLLQMEVCKYAAIHPSFDSDHPHIRQRELTVNLAPTLTVPFIEFTAPIVRADIFSKIQLDEKMPYVGHDMAWSYDVRQLGYEVGVYHDYKLGHTYIRHKKTYHPATQRRKQLRSRAVNQTIQRLTERYGKDYKSKIKYFDKL